MNTHIDHPSPELTISTRKIGLNHPTYFIADIAANHNGDLNEAKELIRLAKQAGADAAKFQHFRAEHIVSQYGFESMGEQVSHQSSWKKSVIEVYRDASVPQKWTEELVKTANAVGIHFFSAPYDLETVNMLDAYLPAYKIGSGDIDWLEEIELIATKQKPIFLATGASSLNEVLRAVAQIRKFHSKVCVMQCNTNYTASIENFRYINLNVLKVYAQQFPDLVLGLSDHTPGHVTVLGAVALGARVIEKHFTRDQKQEGPDHRFSMNPNDWKEMVERTRELEASLGSGVKKVEENERETVLIQRRCIRASKNLKQGQCLTRQDLDVLRPVESGAFLPSELANVVGRKLKKDLVLGEAVREEFVEP